jgi:hypothetical protein
MKLWTVLGAGEVKNTIALHQVKVGKESVVNHLVELLTGNKESDNE